MAHGDALGGEPADVVARVTRYGEWLADSADVPKLLRTFEPGPGTMTGPALLEWCAATITGLEIVGHPLVAGHHTPEDQPDAIAASLAAWLDRHGLRRDRRRRRRWMSGSTGEHRRGDGACLPSARSMRLPRCDAGRDGTCDRLLWPPVARVVSGADESTRGGRSDRRMAGVRGVGVDAGHVDHRRL
ncbi:MULTISPECIES: hypothetical protein [Actinoalloteichus]|uniref:Uncharacterized protein n=1 Tax=Actinoalloteichus fjordicus TaxID=1612552 RepID=A0AAC9LAZ0_9PSEU|nr:MULTISPECIES: hypothetical protein [Actinoalloteichus]APU14583.1 hypothetical protein UA74_12615 [Actinoalloteichus fjordicus]APU20551.1 hypothetical protein UA75_12695 [Actinoalloteichus sp. GBA129-24]